MSLENQVAVVTGAASGIGRASAVRLANDGADVEILDRDIEGLEQTKLLVEKAGQRCLLVYADLLERESIAAAFSEIDTQLGRVDILHNNAGGPARAGTRTFPNATKEQWDEVLVLNLRSVADCTRSVIRGMKERRYGRIITTASEQAYKGGPGFTDYAAAKAGVLGFTRSLALEMAPYSVTVNAICPGVVRTGLTNQMPEEYIEKTISSIPMGRMGEPEEIAHAVAFFASKEAGYVTGTSLLVAGGRTLH